LRSRSEGGAGSGFKIMSAPAWRKPRLRKCSGLLETHRRLVVLLKSAKENGSIGTAKSYYFSLRDNARVIRMKIFRGL